MIKKIIRPVLIMMLLALSAPGMDAAAQRRPEKEETEQGTTGKLVRHFPFVVDDANPEYDLYIDLSDPKVSGRYAPAFRQQGLVFEAEQVEEMIQAILQQEDAALAQVAVTATEDKKVLIGSGNRLYRQKVMQLLGASLGNPEELGTFIRQASRADHD